MSETLPRRGFLGRMVAAMTGGTWLTGSNAQAAAVQIDDQAYISEIRLFAGSTPPYGWLFCQGQLLDPNDENYNALFNLIGTMYGGDGQTTFALPDLRGRTPVHVGTGYVQGQVAGTEQVTLVSSQIPAHTHTLAASATAGSTPDPSGRMPARNAAGAPVYDATANTDLAGIALQPAGGSQPHPNMQPWLGLNFMIAYFGIFPPST